MRRGGRRGLAGDEAQKDLFRSASERVGVVVWEAGVERFSYQ